MEPHYISRYGVNWDKGKIKSPFFKIFISLFYNTTVRDKHRRNPNRFARPTTLPKRIYYKRQFFNRLSILLFRIYNVIPLQRFAFDSCCFCLLFLCFLVRVSELYKRRLVSIGSILRLRIPLMR